MYSDASKFPYSGGYVWISDCCPSRFVSVFSGSLFEGAQHPPSVNCFISVAYSKFSFRIKIKSFRTTTNKMESFSENVLSLNICCGFEIICCLFIFTRSACGSCNETQLQSIPTHWTCIRYGTIYFQANKMFTNKFEKCTTQRYNKGQHCCHLNTLRRTIMHEFVYKQFFLFENNLFYTQHASIVLIYDQVGCCYKQSQQNSIASFLKQEQQTLYFMQC